MIGNPVQLSVASAGSQVTLSWPNTIADTLLEGSPVLGPSAQWQWVTNTQAAGPGLLSYPRRPPRAVESTSSHLATVLGQRLTHRKPLID